MAKFIHKHAEIKFELKEKFFSTEENESEAPVMMDMQEGNINPKPEQIQELQAKQDREEAERLEKIKRVEDEMKKRGDL